VIIDEIQKAPSLLEEVHRLMEERRWRFALCGSSARKLRRGGVNLLGGRAVTRYLESFTASELGDRFHLPTAIEWGCLPLVPQDPVRAADTLSAYVNTYLKEEIREEGWVRRVPPFVRFLAVAGQLNGQAVNGSNIAREAGVPRAAVDAYFSVLQDTLLGHFLPAYAARVKVRERTHPKFFWFDPGVARAAAGLSHDPVDRLWQGTALETLIYHELRVFNEVHQRHRPIAYYRTSAGVEVDFVIETRKRTSAEPPHLVCVEVKLSPRWDRAWERSMRGLAAQAGVKVDRMVGVYTGPRAYRYGDVDVLPVGEFLAQLHQGKVF
jgi:predicted AAA+ superfamily ATPase